MATVQSVIDSARYDLGDFETGIEFDDTELLNYMNRVVGIMDSTLASLQSDLVEAEELDIDCVADQAYVDISALNSGLWDSIRSVWIASDQIYKISVDLMRYKRNFIASGTTAQPRYFALSNNYILFDYACASAYTTLKIYYNKKTAALALSDSMPYNDIFNEMFRESMVVNAIAKKEDRMSRPDILWAEVFRQRAMQEEIRRGFIPTPYYIDF